MHKDANIACPRCGTTIDVNDILYHQLEAEIQKKYNQEVLIEQEKNKTIQLKLLKEQEELAIKQDQLLATIEKNTTERLQVERTKLEASNKMLLEQEVARREALFRNQITFEQNGMLTSLQEELKIKSDEVRELNNVRAEVARVKREKDELESNIKAKSAATYNELLKIEREKIKKQEQEATELKLREQVEQMNILKNQLQEAKRMAEQGSMQLQGEVQELAIEEWLKSQFPFDEISEIKKGQRGADCMQLVHTREIQNCGKIYYESKRTKEFSNMWIEKFKADMRDRSADIGVLVTDVYPRGFERVCLIDGIWICSLEEFKGLAFVLRENIIRLALATKAEENKSDKMSLLYSYLTSNEFRMQVEAIVEGFSQLKIDLDSEKRAMSRIWKQREKQIEKVMENTINMYGSVKGIAGAAIASIQALELVSPNDLLEDLSS